MSRLPLAGVALALVPAVASCQPRPQRVASEDGQCAVSMPSEPRTDVSSVILEGGIQLKLQSWAVGHLGSPDTVAPRGNSAYVLRRATAPAGTSAQGMRLLELAGRKVVAALAAHEYAAPSVHAVAGAAGGAIEVRAGDRQSTAVIRLFAVPDGYCEVAIFGARIEQEVTDYFASVQLAAPTPPSP